MKVLLKCFGIGKDKKKGNTKQQQVVVDEQEEHEKNIKEFRWEELERWTLNFSESRVIGSGGFSTVYKAPEMGAAVKLIYGRRVFEDELDIMRNIIASQSRVVKLLGYSRHHHDDQLAALVLEYVPNGTLQERLADVIPWPKRMSIAYQLAQALHQLHHMSLPIVHGDLKPSNVLLDRHLNCFLCDFGSAKAGFTSSQIPRQRQTLVLAGSPGFTDPHYLRTGIPSKKNDVYSFGVLLLQLVSGTQPFCRATHQSVVDPRLSTRFDPDEAEAMLALAARCLTHPPTLRPSASQIMDAISASCNTTPLSSLISCSQ